MRAFIRLSILALLGLTSGAVFVAKGALHIWRKERPDDAQATAIARTDNTLWRTVQAKRDEEPSRQSEPRP
jgi:hypothetical protein